MFMLGDAQLRPIVGFPRRLFDGVRKRILGGLKRFLFGRTLQAAQVSHGPVAPAAANDPSS